MESQELKITRVLPEVNHKLLEIECQIFYDAFGPSINTTENVLYYLS
ncbi:hypothetical protein [uncultured Aquimarina sp.]|nr:hypothetical protein [uncultured Aquimarina sp.]